ncbi:heterokaryon incompatibility protein-domain-containing protein, partial [Tricladium varicosporioides]
YFTLSHCWGKDQPLKTTLSTLAAHQQSILVSDLPKTYSDAVKVTRHLGVQYLWIDSLCIVQDSKEDWEREAQAMAAIYQNSSLTISATSSADSYGGCYLEIDNATTEGISKPTREGHRYLVRLRRQVRREDLATPLLRRGWVFQETLLSRRVLHLTSNQMFWHCQERFRSEDGSISAESGSGVATYDVELGFCKKTTIGDHRLWVREHIWQRWCEDYSRRAFTYEEDKLPALAGLMSYIEKSTKSTPPLGLWMSTLHLDLAWRVNDTKKTSRLTGLPSWAWLSVRGGI